MTMTYASVCDGIGAAHVAAARFGWRCAWTSEIEPFPAAVVEHHWGYANVGDMLKITPSTLEKYDAINLLVGGTPCQSFSVAGLRGGLDDPRGNLALRFAQLAAVARPRWLVWENVPGVLSSGGGRDFGSIIGAIVELGYGVAWRILDAQYVRVDGWPRAVPQRRRRVFVVGHLGDARRAGEVLLEPASVCGNTAPRRQAWAHVASSLTRGLGSGGPDAAHACANWLQPVANPLTACMGKGVNTTCDEGKTMVLAFDPAQVTSAKNYSNPKPGDPCPPLTSAVPAIAHTLRAEGRDASEDGTGRGVPVVVGCDVWNSTLTGGIAATLGTGGSPGGGGVGPQVMVNHAVRRLTPRECERLQGFPDDYTNIVYRGKPAADAPRYRALGNSMACNVMTWIFGRINQADARS